MGVLQTVHGPCSEQPGRCACRRDREWEDNTGMCEELRLLQHFHDTYVHASCIDVVQYCSLYCTCLHVHTHIHVCMFTYVHIHVCMAKCMCLSAFTCSPMCVHTCVNSPHVHMWVCTCNRSLTLPAHHPRFLSG